MAWTGPAGGDHGHHTSNFELQQMQAALMAAQGAAHQPGGSHDHLGGLPAATPQVDPNMLAAYWMMMHQQGMASGNVAGGLPTPAMPFPGLAPFSQQMAVEPSITVTVEGMKFQYQLTEDDLQKVFSRYGTVRLIRIDEQGHQGVITYSTTAEAQAAISELNGKVLAGLDGVLRIQWASGAPAATAHMGAGAAPAPAFPNMGFPGLPSMPFGGVPGWPLPATGGLPPGGSNGVVASAVGGVQPGAAVPATSSGHSGVRKYTCRFLIGIDNDKEFQVARKIIGAKGINMKEIFKNTQAKLRLRGQGSGYVEGASQKESSEPLQLCISSQSPDGYAEAKRLCSELLERIYREYAGHCSENNIAVPELKLSLTENQLVYSDSKGVTETAAAQVGGAGLEDKNKRNRRGNRAKAKSGGEGSVERGEPGPNAPPVEDIEKLIDERNEARRACDFTEADRIRTKLASMGVALMDEKGGRGRGTEVTSWRYWRD
eukprot:TRINITY_DN596_c0_g1_i4.p1 TRINITY_DN596_c0_g1~~TRINITY_DN596_c0_g1_i4.p1  ORF type:complete len:487 (+),score=100.74 TRINITY_DN596_c0_g1_i4:171-1631(+)